MSINIRASAIALVLTGIISSSVFAVPQQDETADLLLRGAKQWDAKNRPDRAVNLLHKVILIEPASTEALFMLGDIALRNGKPDEALRYLHSLEQTAPGSPRTLKLGDMYRQRTGDKTSMFNRPTVAQSDTLAAPVAKSASAAKHEKHAKPARVHTEKAKTVAKKQPVASEDTASTALDPDIIARTDALDALADGNVEQAETALLDIIKRRPHDAEVIGGLGLVRQKQGKFVESEQFFRQALAAAQAAKGETARWVGLIDTAIFSQHMTDAKALLEENKLQQAQAAVQQALTLKPGDPDALAVEGNIKAAGNDLVEAERLYREALKIEGYNIFAARGLASLLAATQRNDEAIEFIEQVLQTYPNEWKKNPASQANLLREEANLYVAAHQNSQAIKALETALIADPKNAWVRFSLAKLYISLNMVPLARQIVQEGAALAPKDPAMNHVRALVMLSLNDYAAGIDSLNQIPEESLTQDMRDTKKRALNKYYFQQADLKYAQGNRREAIRIMSVAEAQARGDFAATEQVAEGWFRLGQQKAGLSAMRKLPQPAPLQTQVHFASLLNRAKKDQELAEYLPTLHIPDATDETHQQYRATIQDIEFAMAGREFDRLLKAGKKEQAQQFAQTILNANRLSNSDYFKFHRSYFSAAELPDNAIAALNQEKEQNPDDLNMRWELAYAYYQNKQNSNAQRELQELLPLTAPDNIDTRLRIAKLQQNTGDSAGARRIIDDLTSRYPNNTEVLLQAGNIARSAGKYNLAMRYYKLAKVAAKTPEIAAGNVQTPDILLNLLPETSLQTMIAAPTLASTAGSEQIYRTAIASEDSREVRPANSDVEYADQAMTGIEAMSSPKIEAGLDIQRKSATSGMSTYNATEIPLLARFPVGYEAHGTVQVDKVNVDAGSLALADAAKFGKGQAIGQPLAQQASGTSVALGYEQDSVKADIGIAGQGFLVSNVVGGIRHGGEFGHLSYSLNLSRRPYTGSLISYAGTRDPATGAVWGGVTNTGLTLYMSTTLESFNAAAMASYGLLRGTNVLNNDRLFLRAAVDKDIYTGDDMVLNAGLGVNYTSFSKNESFYTFGHGGYWSPRSSVSLGLPVELSGRSDLLSYQIRASVSYARTTEDSALYYPTDSALQAAAAGIGQAVYQGSTGSGFGYGLRAATEYRATPNFALGGRFNMDRSAYYAPNSLLFYLRYMFTPETGPVKLRPDPVIPYSQY